MSLLIFAVTAAQERPETSLEGFLRALGEACPHAFVLALTLRPPPQTQPEASWDWVTLPSGAELNQQLAMLHTYAAWLRPTVSLLWHTDENEWVPHLSAPAFGVCLEAAGYERGDLLAELRRRLPVTLVLDAALTPELLDTTLAACDPQAPLSLHCPKALTQQVRSTLQHIAERHAGPVRLSLPLKHGLLHQRALRDVAFLYSLRQRVEVTVCDELGTPLPAALNRLWSALGGKA